MTGIRWTLRAALAAVVAAGAAGAWAAGAPPRAVAAAAAAGLLGAALARIGLRRALGAHALAVSRFAAAQREGRLDARLPGTWGGELRPIAESLNAMAAVLATRLRGAEARGARLEAVIGAMDEAVLVVDGAERVLLANPQLRALLGSSGDEPAPDRAFLAEPAPEGRAFLELVRQAEVVDALRAALRAGEIQEREAAFGLAGERCVRFRVAPFTQPDGLPGAVAVFRDVTDLRRVESIRRDFVANASHELKTPLTSIQGYAERLSGMALPEAARPAVHTIVGNAKRLGALVEDLLELSRIEGGAAPSRPAPVDVAGLARRLLDDLAPRLHAGALAAEVRALGDPRAWADRGAVEQVLANLLDNAVKYTPAGGSIEVSVRPGADQRLRVTVSDTGIGIPRKDLPRIFERFYRVDPGRSRALGGTGLGLAIVKHLVQAQGGQLGVESQPGRGSRFWVELPRPAGPLARAGG
ncbi:MAG: ATP-binding protein [Deltaproteobacteria bacterium]|nr:ATP-binding protein [Deltaproteobacteria bacterium]